MINARQQRERIRALRDPEFQAELHALLWIDAFDNHGAWDGGWSCRDHTAVVGAFLMVAGFDLTILHGRCYFVQGPTADGWPPVAVGQDLAAGAGHTWLGVDGLGHVDLSPKLGLSHDGWRAISSMGIIGEEWLTDRRSGLLVVGDATEYRAAVRLGVRQVDAQLAVYLMEEYEQDGFTHAADGLRWANSPLTDRLLESGISTDAYGRFAVHLAGLVAGERPPLRGLSQHEAWEVIASDDGLKDATSAWTP